VTFDPETLGKYIQRLRQARGLTEEMLAQSSGLPTETVTQLESGALALSLEMLTRLCVALRLDASAFFEALESEARTVAAKGEGD
jgi:transcriptional regulator with XRE-family HTH domain